MQERPMGQGPEGERLVARISMHGVASASEQNAEPYAPRPRIGS